MKIRNGYVSNSSSSSFIIGVKGKLTSSKLMSAFEVSKKSPLYPLAKELAEIMVNSSEKTTEEKYEEDHFCKPKILKKITQRGMNIYCGSADDQSGNDLEVALCSIDLNYDSDDLIIEKEGGY